MIDPTKIDWWDTLTGIISGMFIAVVSLFGWFGRKLSAYDKRIEAIEDAAAECRIHQGVQAEQHTQNQGRLCRIEEGVIKIADRLDEILLKRK